MNQLSPLLQIEAKRIAAAASIGALAHLAGINERHYRAMLEGKHAPRASTLAKLRSAALRLGKVAASLDDHARLIRTCYFAALALVCQRAGVDAGEVRRHDPSRRATGDPAWRRAAEYRRRAIAIVNLGLNVEQSELARAIGMTPAGICVAMRGVEDARAEDPALDAELDELAALMSGGE